jgi:hypothetical protein
VVLVTVSGAAVLASTAAISISTTAPPPIAPNLSQPDWRRPLSSGRLPAPPHDATGHTWHHPDRMLREIILRGTAAMVGDGYESDMPGFADLLTEAEVEAILDYLKSEWPERERAHQARVTTADEAAGG